MASEKDLLYLQEKIEVIKHKARAQLHFGDQDTANAFLSVAEALGYIVDYFMEKEQAEQEDLSAKADLDSKEPVNGA